MTAWQSSGKRMPTCEDFGWDSELTGNTKECSSFRFPDIKSFASALNVRLFEGDNKLKSKKWRNYRYVDIFVSEFDTIRSSMAEASESKWGLFWSFTELYLESDSEKFLSCFHLASQNRKMAKTRLSLLIRLFALSCPVQVENSCDKADITKQLGRQNSPEQDQPLRPHPSRECLAVCRNSCLHERYRNATANCRFSRSPPRRTGKEGGIRKLEGSWIKKMNRWVGHSM